MQIQLDESEIAKAIFQYLASNGIKTSIDDIGLHFESEEECQPAQIRRIYAEVKMIKEKGK